MKLGHQPAPEWLANGATTVYERTFAADSAIGVRKVLKDLSSDTACNGKLTNPFRCAPCSRPVFALATAEIDGLPGVTQFRNGTVPIKGELR